MSVVSMRLISIIGFINELDATSSACVSISAFEPDSVDNFFKDADKFQPFVNNNDSISLENELISITEKIGKKVSLSKDNSMISKKQISKYISSLSEKCEKISNKIKKMHSEIETNNKIIDDLSHFSKFNYNMSDIKNLEYIDAKFIEISKYDFEYLISNEEINEKIEISKISSTEEKCYCVVFISKEFEPEIENLFKKFKINEINLSDLESTPNEEIEKLKMKNEEIKVEIKKLHNGIDKFWQHQNQYCSRAYSCLTEYEKFETVKQFAKTYKNNFVLIGWIPEDKVEEISGKLDKISRIEYSIESGDELLKFSPPTKLKNKKIFSPFEFFVSTYGLPKYSDMDPTSFVAVTYTIIFGLMFADVGQGLLLSLIGLFLSKVKKLDLGKIITMCGISASLFGFVFGSVFGFEHLLDQIYSSIGLKPIRVMESSMSIIISSICIGVFCLILSMCMNIYSLVKKHNDILEAVFSHNGLCGIVLYSSLILLIIGNPLNLNKIILTFATFSIPAMLTMIFFKEAFKNKSKNMQINWGDYITSNLFELFEFVLGYFTNTISFVRIGVFLFVHAGMMMVVFTLAKMSGGFLYPLILIFGNIFVTCFESLLVGMQVMRLQFCELFGRFFEGGGREFKPVVSRMKKI